MVFCNIKGTEHLDMPLDCSIALNWKWL